MQMIEDEMRIFMDKIGERKLYREDERCWKLLLERSVRVGIEEVFKGCNGLRRIGQCLWAACHVVLQLKGANYQIVGKAFEMVVIDYKGCCKRWRANSDMWRRIPAATAGNKTMVLAGKEDKILPPAQVSRLRRLVLKQGEAATLAGDSLIHSQRRALAEYFCGMISLQ